jgi:aspartate aminotransferase
MTRSLSARASRLKPSPTLAVTGKAKRLAQEGRDIVSFAAGEPDFNTPEPVIDAAVRALRDGQTKYTPSAGTPALREAIAEKLRRENSVDAEAANIVVSCGAKHSVYNAMQVLIDPGDEVLLLAPYWPTYADQVVLAGGVPVIVDCATNDGFQPDLDRLRAAVTPRTRMIVVNTPVNPTGAVFGREALKQIAALALRHDLWIVSDEIYERLVYDGEHQSLAALGKDVAERTVTVNGCSKTYAMTGWRIGYACAPKEIAQAMSNLQDQVTSNPTSFAQAGALEALRMPDATIVAMRETFRRRRDAMLAGLREAPGLAAATPHGAFYVFADARGLLGRTGWDDCVLADRLLDEEGVAVVPGTHFGGPGHVRLTYSASESDIVEGTARIVRFFGRHSA